MSQLRIDWLSTAAFMIAIGVAHSFVVTRYFVTVIAATVMALLQAHLAHPLGGFAVPERLADTVLGALLAWAFSYVLPYWERRAAPRIATGVTRALALLAQQVLRWPEGRSSDTPVRLARRQVYDALASIAATAQRTGAEPERVRVSLPALAALLTHSHALLAHLAAVKLMLARRASELDRDEIEAALRDVTAEVQQRLESAHGAPAAAITDTEPDDPALPAQPADYDLMPWLRRRLRKVSLAAAKVGVAARALQDSVNAS